METNKTIKISELPTFQDLISGKYKPPMWTGIPVIHRIEELSKELFDEPIETMVKYHFKRGEIEIELTGFKKRIGVRVGQRFSQQAVYHPAEEFYQMVKADFARMIAVRVKHEKKLKPRTARKTRKEKV